MRVDWYGQSAFRLTGEQATVFIDPFGDMSPLADRGLQFDYPAIEDVSAELLLITHEHRDHNAAEVIGGDPAILRSTAGVLQSPIGDVVAVASEHDERAGTERGPNTIFCLTLDGIRVAHFGDFGQRGLRPEQQEAIGEVDLLILPVGGGPTVGAAAAIVIVEELSPRWVVPMHYRTPKLGFLETAEEFLDKFEHVERRPEPSFETGSLGGVVGTLVVVPAVP